MALEFNESNFDEYLKSNKPMLIDFGADWCGPCRTVAPIIEELYNQYSQQVNIGKLNIDTSPTIPARYNVRNIPTVLYIKNGEVIDKQVGAASKKVFEDKLKNLL